MNLHHTYHKWDDVVLKFLLWSLICICIYIYIYVGFDCYIFVGFDCYIFFLEIFTVNGVWKCNIPPNGSNMRENEDLHQIWSFPNFKQIHMLHLLGWNFHLLQASWIPGALQLRLNAAVHDEPHRLITWDCGEVVGWWWWWLMMADDGWRFMV